MEPLRGPIPDLDFHLSMCASPLPCGLPQCQPALEMCQAVPANMSRPAACGMM